MIFSPCANPRLRVNGPAQMIVQVTALRHAQKKIPKLQRILPSRLETELSFLFGTFLRRRTCITLLLSQDREGDQEQQHQKAPSTSVRMAPSRIPSSLFHK